MTARAIRAIIVGLLLLLPLLLSPLGFLLGEGELAAGEHEYEYGYRYDLKEALARQLKGLNAPPIAQFSFTPRRPTAGELVRFIDSSWDIDGYLVFWGWDFGDGTTCPPECGQALGGDTQSPLHRYGAPGAYTVTLTVIDQRGALSRITRELTVASRLIN